MRGLSRLTHGRAIEESQSGLVSKDRPTKGIIMNVLRGSVIALGGVVGAGLLAWPTLAVADSDPGGYKRDDQGSELVAVEGDADKDRDRDRGRDRDGDRDRDRGRDRDGDRHRDTKRDHSRDRHRDTKRDHSRDGHRDTKRDHSRDRDVSRDGSRS
jgi:hypothetical protein